MLIFQLLELSSFVFNPVFAYIWVRYFVVIDYISHIREYWLFSELGDLL